MMTISEVDGAVKRLYALLRGEEVEDYYALRQRVLDEIEESGSFPRTVERLLDGWQFRQEHDPEDLGIALDAEEEWVQEALDLDIGHDAICGSVTLWVTYLERVAEDPAIRLMAREVLAQDPLAMLGMADYLEESFGTSQCIEAESLRATAEDLMSHIGMGTAR